MDASKRTVRCPLCGRATPWTDNPHRPFCSERCQLADLAGWLGGRYVIPGDPEEAAEPQPGSDPSEGPDSSPYRGKDLTSHLGSRTVRP
jgi:endogenous inhibitor of DNA gyrase (YacG/DUF329 family)